MHAEISTSDSYISILDNIASFGDILCCGAAKQALDDFGISISSGCPTPHTATFDLIITDDQTNSWTSSFTLSVYTSSQISGYVTTLTGGNPVEGATVEFSGPLSGSVQTNGSGYYMFGGIDGTYEITVLSDDYLPSTPQSVIIPPNATNVNFLLSRPEIAVTPLSIDETILVGESIDVNATIFNNGDAPLEFTISSVDNTLSLPAQTKQVYADSHFVDIPKDQKDTRIGLSVKLGKGGPDTFGYSWKDSDEPGGPQFVWNDISGTGTRLSDVSGCDDCFQEQAISFSFPFYGNEFTSIFVSSNGFITFGSGSSQIGNYPLPSASAPPNLIDMLHDDLYPPSQGDIYFREEGNEAIVQFENVLAYNGSGNYTFQIVLKNDGTVMLYYSNLTGDLNGCTVGIQNEARDDGLTVVYNASYLKNSLAIEIRFAPEWLRTTPVSGTVNPGSSLPISVTLDATELFGGVYSGTLEFAHNDPMSDNPISLPCVLTVDGIKRLAVTPEDYNFGNVWYGGQGTTTLSLTNAGDEATTVGSITSNNGEFTHNAVLPLTVPPFESVTFEAIFAPVDVGAESGVLTINSDAEDNPVLTVNLSGTGTVSPEIAVSPGSFSEVLDAGNSVVRPLTITNNGGDDLNYSIIGAGSGTPPDLLVSYWPFSEGTGDILNDEIGNNDGVIKGAVWVYDEGRSALSFNGIDDTVLVPHPVDGSMDFGTDDFSVAVWINTTANTGTSGYRDEILSKGDASINGFALSARNNNACFWVGSSGYFFGTSEINDGEWHLIVGVREAGTVRLYVDANLETSGSNSQSVNTATDCFIGMHGTKDLCYFEGLISSTYLYAKALTIEEIEDIYGSLTWLSIPNPSGTVQSGSSADVDIVFQAIGLFEGDYFGQLSLTHNAPGDPSPLVIPCALTVNGFRDLTVSPENYDFGNIWAGLQSSVAITLSNAGNEATTVNSITSDNGEFTHNAVVPLTVPPLGSATFEAIFAPLDVGVESGVLTINSDAEDDPIILVNLTGNGTQPPQANLDPTLLTYNLQHTDAPADQTSVLSNIGGDVLSYQVYSVRETSSPLLKFSKKRKNSIPAIRHDIIYHDKNYQNPFVPGRIIVGFKENKNSFADATILSSIGTESVRELAIAKSPVTHLKVNKGRKLILISLSDNTIDGVLAAIGELRNDPNVAYAEPDYIVKAIATPNDPHYSLLYGMHNTGQTGGTADADIDAPEAWDRHTGNRSILIGVIDTGIDYNHPDLAANIWTNPGEIPANGVDDDGNGFIDDVYGWDFAYDDNDPMDGHYHGTHCAGTIAGVGNNGVGVVGVMWEADVVAIKFLSDGGSGSTSDAIDAVNYTTAMGIHITSNSWGGGGFSQGLMDAIAAGDLFIAAAGNYSSNNDVSPYYPASFELDNIISVAATDHNDNLASFSNYGATTVDLGAPGVQIYSCQPGAGYQYLNGTSMATPHVSGAVGLVWSYNPMLTALEAKQIVLENVDPISSLDGMVLTGGRLNVDKAIAGTVPSWLSVLPLDPGTLNPGEDQIYTVTVDPAGLIAGQWQGEIVVGTNDPLHPELSLEVTANIAGSKSLVVSPNSLDFGSVWIGLDVILQLTLINDGNEATTVNSITSNNGEFTHNAVLPLTVPPFESVTFEAIFAPVDVGAESGVLTINSDAGDNPLLTVDLSGTGTAPPEIAVSPGSFTERLNAGNSLTRILTIANNGGDDLNYSIIGGSDAPMDFLVTYWPFSEGTGDVLNDEIGNNNGVIKGAVWAYEEGKSALSFNGINDTVLVPHPVDGSMDFGTGDFSVAVWINTTANTGTAGSRDEIISKGDASINGFALSARNNNACFWVGSSGYFYGTSQINNGEWHLIVGVREAGTVRLYVDANLETSGSNSQNVNTATDCFIGMHGTKDLCYFDGLISSTYLYEDALTIEEIEDIYTSLSWLTAPDPSGTVQSGSSADVNIVFQATGLVEGDYFGQLNIIHNDPGEPVPLVVPCALTVTSVSSYSHILFIGQSANTVSFGEKYIMDEIIIGSPTSGIVKGTNYELILK